MTLPPAEALGFGEPLLALLTSLGGVTAWHLLLQWTFGSLVVFGVARLLNRRPDLNAATKVRLWTVTLWSLLLLPLLAWQLDDPTVASAALSERGPYVVPAQAPRDALAQAEPLAASQVVLSDARLSGPGSTLSSIDAASIDASAGAGHDRVVLNPRGAAVARVALPLLFFVWSSGVVLRLIWLGGGMIQLVELRATSRTDAAASRRLALLAPQVGCTAVPAVRRADVVTPCCVGVLRPWIALPGSAADPSIEVSDEVLLHELAHCERRDGLSALLEQLARTLLMAAPAASYAVRAIASERESACDDWVLHHTRDPLRYGRVLLAEAERVAVRAPAAVAALAPGMARARRRRGPSINRRRNELRERMERMLDSRRHHGRAVSRRATSICGTGLLAAVASLAWVWPGAPRLQLSGTAFNAPAALKARTEAAAPRLPADDAPLYRAVRQGGARRSRTSSGQWRSCPSDLARRWFATHRGRPTRGARRGPAADRCRCTDGSLGAR